eukprot:212489-Chlamydomonas_euryale.AAC.1
MHTRMRSTARPFPFSPRTCQRSNTPIIPSLQPLLEPPAMHPPPPTPPRTLSAACAPHRSHRRRAAPRRGSSRSG